MLFLRYAGPILQLESVAYGHELRYAVCEVPLPIACRICCHARNTYEQYNIAYDSLCDIATLKKVYAIRSGVGAPQGPTFVCGLALHVVRLAARLSLLFNFGA